MALKLNYDNFFTDTGLVQETAPADFSDLEYSAMDDIDSSLIPSKKSQDTGSIDIYNLE